MSKAENNLPAPPAQPGLFADPQRHTRMLCLLLVALTVIFYAPIAHNHFVDFDDAPYIAQNPQIQSGLTWGTVKWAFTTFREGNWHPLTWLSHALDCQLFHLNPVGHHYMNLLLHATNALLLFLLLKRATRATWASWLVGALFAVHPMNVESVAWAAERKNVLSMLFFLLTLYAYDRYVRTEKKWLYVAVAVLFAAGLMAKPQIVTLPFVLLLWDYWPLRRFGTGVELEGGIRRRTFWSLIWEKWPLFLLAAADSVITVIAQRSDNTVRSLAQVSLAARLENVFVSYARYLGKAVWPSSLSPMYPHPGNSLALWQVAGAAVVVLGISVWVARRLDHPYLVMGWCWFLGTLVPMIGIITVGDQAMADRYAYLPFVGLFIAVVWIARDWAVARKVPAGWLAGAAALVLLVLGCLTYRQIPHWADEETLWSYALTVTDKNYVAHNNLALAQAKAGRPDLAMVHFRAARALHYYPPEQVVQLAVYESRVGFPEYAADDFKFVIGASSNPTLRQFSYRQMGRVLLQLRRYDEAGKAYAEALRLNPEDGAALIGSGALAMHAGDFKLAIAQFSHAVKVDPSDINLLLLAQGQRQAGQLAEADKTAERARQVSTDMGAAEGAVEQFLGLVGIVPI